MTIFCGLYIFLMHFCIFANKHYYVLIILWLFFICNHFNLVNGVKICNVLQLLFITLRKCVMLQFHYFYLQMYFLYTLKVNVWLHLHISVFWWVHFIDFCLPFHMGSSNVIERMFLASGWAFFYDRWRVV